MKFDSNCIFVDPRKLVFVVNFYISPLFFPWKLMWCNLNKQFYLVPLFFLPQLLSQSTQSFLSSNVTLLKSLLTNIFCPFNLLSFWNVFVLSLNCHNFKIIFRGLLVLLPLLLHFTRCACSISIPSNPSFCLNIS